RLCPVAPDRPDRLPFRLQRLRLFRGGDRVGGISQSFRCRAKLLLAPQVLLLLALALLVGSRSASEEVLRGCSEPLPELLVSLLAAGTDGLPLCLERLHRLRRLAPLGRVRELFRADAELLL